MNLNRWVQCGALLTALAVGLGAYGAHGLEGAVAARFSDEEGDQAWRLERWETAVRYQLVHGPAIVLVGLLAALRRSKWLAAAGWSFVFGMGIFCGLLYVMTFAPSTLNWLGAVVPLGGLALIGGWVLIAVGSCGCHVKADE